MRQIKYRAWSLGKMLSHDELRTYEDVEPGVFFNMLDDAYDGTHLMQYTGIKDKNGVEIYEGDIVECAEKEMFNKRKNHIKFVSPVFWEDLSWTLRESETCDVALCVYDDSPTKRPVTTIKVIGNIYQNPNLLEKKQ